MEIFIVTINPFNNHLIQYRDDSSPEKSKGKIDKKKKIYWVDYDHNYVIL